MRTKVPAEEKRVMFRAELASHQQMGEEDNSNTQFLSNTIVCMCNVIETFLHDWFEIIFAVLIKEGAHCRQHSQSI
jgi:hypothetical protein